MIALFSRLRARLRAVCRPGAIERDIDDELRYHLEREAETFARAGMSADDARAAALRAFGGLEPSRESLRDISAARGLADRRQDLVYALRMLRRDPALAIVAISTLALVVGANTAVFSVVDGVLLKPLNLPAPDRVVIIHEQTPARPEMPVAHPDYLDWVSRQSTFDVLGASIVIGGVLTGDGEPERAFGRAVDRGFLAALGVMPALGRNFTASEDRPGGERAMILGHALWQHRYGADGAIVGRAVHYNGDAYTVVGVLPASFEFYGTANANNDFLLPLGHLADTGYMRDRDSHPLQIVGRLKTGVPIARARADLSAIAAALAQEYPATNAHVGVGLRSLLDDYVGDVRTMLAVLLAAALLVLAVACANIANLLLARAWGRHREIAVRLALGASRRRIASQLLTESLVLSIAGGAIGVVVGMWAAAAVQTAAPASLPRLEDIGLDWRVVLFSAATTLVAGLGFGLVPALQATGVDLRRFLGEGGRGSTSSARRVREVLVVAQMTLCIALLVGAGLLVRSFAAVLRADPGFDPDHVVTMRVRLPDGRYRDRAQVRATLERALSRIASAPGIDAVCLTTGVPLGRSNEERYVIDGQPAASRDRMPVALAQWITPEYHDTLRVPLIAGRYFGAWDREGSGDVAIVDEEFIARAFPGAAAPAALGRRVQLAGENGRWRAIVGVVRHVRHGGLDERPRAEIYAPFEQMDPAWQLEIGRAMDMAVRSGSDAGAVVATVREQLRAIDPELPLSHVRTMTEAISLSMAPRAFTLALLALFAAVAVVLCTVGLYGVLSYAVTQRTREIGIRLALGARPSELLALLMDRGLKMILTGSALGLALALLTARLLRELLYGVGAGDPLTFAAAAALLGAVAFLASYVPARRAAQMDPLSALRGD